MNTLKLLLTGLVVLSITSCSTSPKKPAWQVQSDRIAQEHVLDFAEIFPEDASKLGYQQFDKLGEQPSHQTRLLYFEKLKQWERKLQTLLEDTHSADLRIDLEILLVQTQLDLEHFALDEQERLVAIGRPSQSIFNSMSQLVNEQFSPERQRRAVDRFKSYMSTQNKNTYVTDLKQRLLYDKKRYEGKLTAFSYPSTEFINNYLKNSDSFVAGIEELLTKTGRTNWKNEFETFKTEVHEYDLLLKQEILPLAPKRTQLSRKRYELRLKRFGNSTSPENMIREGKKVFQKDYLELKGLAQEIAKKHSLKNSSPAYVTQFLKNSAVKDAHEAKALYQKANQRLESLIKKHDLVTLPQKPLLVRLGSKAESKASPVPHLNIPPLLNNKGEIPEFVVPTGESQNELPYDDFSHFGMALALTAHEGRPGHDLQFQHILEKPISIIRAAYAFNSVNVEGWALYAEQIMVPHLNLEEQFSFLQSKMWRVARYFLDPMIHLGQANKKFVIQVLHKQLGLSEALSQTEYDRYSFRMPGQAPSYYQGYYNLVTFKKRLEAQIGKMETKCFHDTLLSLGLMPHNRLESLKNNFVDCKQM